MIGRTGLLVARIAFAGVFLLAAGIKITGPDEFLTSIEGFKILPEHLEEPMAFVVPWVEAVCGVALLAGFWGRSAALVLGGMLLVFIGAILSAIARDMSLECGCFGKFALLCDKGELDWCNVWQNVLLMGLALPVMIWGPGLLSWDSWARARCQRTQELDETGA